MCHSPIEGPYLLLHMRGSGIGCLTQCEPMKISLGVIPALERKSHSIAHGILKPMGDMQRVTGDYLPLCGSLRMKPQRGKWNQETERHFPDDIT